MPPPKTIKKSKPLKADIKTQKKPVIQSKRKNLLFYILSCCGFILVSFLLYYPTLNYPLDKLDEKAIVGNNLPLLKDYSNINKALTSNAFYKNLKTFYRPVQNLSFMSDAHLGGGNAIGFRVTNLILHIAVFCLLFFLLTGFNVNRVTALLITMVFIVHPLFVHAVVWIPSRGDLLITLLGLVSFMTYKKYLSSKSVIYLIFGSIAYAIALFSKETAIMLPAVYFVYYYLFHKKSVSKKTVCSLLVFVPVPFIYFACRNILTVAETNTGTSAFFKNLPALPESFLKIFLPLNLTPLPVFSGLFTSGGIIAVLLAVLLIYKMRNNNKVFSFLVFGLLWFLAFSLPALLFRHPLAVHGYEYLDQRIYLPATGIIVALAVLADHHIIIMKKTTSLIIAFIIVILLFYVRSYTYSQVYKDDVSFYSRAIRINPESALSYNNRGLKFSENKIYNSGLKDFNNALKIDPAYSEAYNNRGLLYYNINNYDSALADYSMAVKYNAGYAEAYYNRGLCWSNMKKYDKALSDFNRALQIRPDYAVVFENRGLLYYYTNKYDSALTDLNKAIELDPTDVASINNRGLFYKFTDRVDAALQDFNRAIALKPGYTEAIYNRGLCYYSTGNYDKALSDYNRAISTDPGFYKAYNDKGVILLLKKEYGKALIEFKKAVQLNPDYSPAVNNIRLLETQYLVKGN
jgi:tetratricopeptide (TPR) repeat protein